MMGKVQYRHAKESRRAVRGGLGDIWKLAPECQPKAKVSSSGRIPRYGFKVG